MDTIKIQDIQLGKWYKVLIGFATKPDIRSGYCVRGMLKSGDRVQVMGEYGTIENTESYINYINSVVKD